MYVKWKEYDNHFDSWIGKPFNSHFGDSIKVKTDLSNYATKADIKNTSHVDTTSFALKKN